MAYGMQVYDRSGNTTLDTSSATWVQVALLSIGKGDSASTVNFDGASLPAGMQLKVALQVIDDLPTDEKQIVPTVTVVNSPDNARSVTVQSASGTTTNSENETYPAYSAACTIIILGR